MNIILSIKPKYAELIYSGKKTVEWRHTYPKKNFYWWDCVYIYETAPVKRVTGYFKVNPIIAPIYFDVDFLDRNDFYATNVKKNFEKWGQVSIDQLKKYSERSPVYGWQIVKYERYICTESINWLNLKRPPQSWQYLNTNKEVTK